jgi:pimeloyl-ACP methyl ester carboxylesterase
VKFVMVPGGWQGGWVFDSVAAELHRNGHDVEAVTLSGLELDGPVDVDRPPNLDTHIDQVAEVIDRGNETGLAMCGHSYGGMVSPVSRTGSATASISWSSSTPTSRTTVIRVGL